MDFDDFKGFLEKLPIDVRIDFSGMAEPWLNKSATDMLQFSLLKGHKVAVYTTLEGMTIEDAKRVIETIKEHGRQVEVLTLHLADNENNMRGFRFTPEYGEVLRLFMSSREDLQASNFSVMTMSGSGNFHSELESLVPKPAVPFRGHSRAGTLTDREIEPPPTPQNSFPLSCRSTPFYDRNVLLPNGDVYLCCMDYNLQHKLGNLHENSYLDLFRSETLRELVVVNQRPDFSKCSLCKSCDNVLSETEYLRAGYSPDGLRRKFLNLFRR